MAYEKKNGDFVLFPNERKQGNQPDYRGSIFLNGQEFEIACWNKTSKAGNRFISGNMGKVKEDKPKDSVGWGNKPASNHLDDVKMSFDDDIPWK